MSQEGPLGYRELGDLAGIVWLDRLPAKNPDIEVFGFVLVANGEELSCEEAFVCNLARRLDSCGASCCRAGSYFSSDSQLPGTLPSGPGTG